MSAGDKEKEAYEKMKKKKTKVQKQKAEQKKSNPVKPKTSGTKKKHKTQSPKLQTLKKLFYEPIPAESAKEKWKGILRLAGRILGAVLTLLCIIYFFQGPEFYQADKYGNPTSVFTNGRSWFMLFTGILMIAFSLMPNRLPEKVNRILGWIWFAAAPTAVYFTLFHMNATKFKIKFFELSVIALILTFVFLYLVAVMLLIVTGSVRIPAVILSILIALIGIGNWYVVAFRGQALSGADLFNIGAAATVASEYSFTVTWYVFSEIYLTFMICLISLKIRGFQPLKPLHRLVVLLIWGMLSGGYFHLCCRTSFLEDHDIRSWGFTHQLRYKKYDMLFTTLTTCFYLVVDQPSGYSGEKVQEIAEPYEQTAIERNTVKDGEEASYQMPNLIVVMNESFADYENIGKGLKLSSDNMPYIHGLTENTIKGYAYASIFGANTPNSEYEFLTGNTMGFLPTTSVGFNLFVRGKMPSLASQLKSLGYNTLAIHPYRNTNYRRNIVYPQIGFDLFLHRNYFLKPEKIRSYVSDMELARKIIQTFRQYKTSQPDKPLLSYSVSMQNHGDYLRSNVTGVPTDIKVYNSDVNRIKTSIYVNLIKKSDEMFHYLTAYFSRIKEPTVILMFGDHQANLGDNTYEYLLGKPEEELTEEELMEKYKIPFVIWANYDIESEYIEATSLNYLYAIMADRLNLPMTGYQDYLLEMSEEIPVLAAGGYWTKDGEFYELRDKTSPYYDKINEYNILEYNYIFGKENRELDLFTMATEEKIAG